MPSSSVCSKKNPDNRFKSAQDVTPLLDEIIMLLSVCTASTVKKICAKIRWNDAGTGAKILQTIRTFLIVLIGEAMFRANSLPDAFTIYRNIFTNTRINASTLAAALTPFGNGNQALASVLILAVLILVFFLVELRKEKDPQAF